jgi:hypothetical protein
MYRASGRTNERRASSAQAENAGPISRGAAPDRRDVMTRCVPPSATPRRRRQNTDQQLVATLMLLRAGSRRRRGVFRDPEIGSLCRSIGRPVRDPVRMGIFRRRAHCTPSPGFGGAEYQQCRGKDCDSSRDRSKAFHGSLRLVRTTRPEQASDISYRRLCSASCCP